MKLYSPKYYSDFKCKLGKCKNSCCIGWEIGVDENTYSKYKTSKHDRFDRILSTIDSDSPDGVLHFKLKDNGRCPHLRDDGLCDIIVDLGEEAIPEICREHPRYYNLTERGLEVGVGLSCEAATELIFSSDDVFPICIRERECDEELPSFSLKERDALLSIAIEDNNIFEKIESIASLYSIPLSAISKDNINSVLPTLEYLRSDTKNLFTNLSPKRLPTEKEERILGRVLAYFIYRHASSAEDNMELRASVGASLFLTSLLTDLILSDEESEKRAQDIARRISEELEYSEDNLEEIKLSIDFF